MAHCTCILSILILLGFLASSTRSKHIEFPLQPFSQLGNRRVAQIEGRIEHVSFELLMPWGFLLKNISFPKNLGTK